MKNLILVITTMFLAMHSYSQVSQAKWIDSALIIDGDNADWGGRPSFYSSECSMMYELRNNKDYLFVILEITDKKSQLKFMHAGFEMNLTAKTKPKLNAIISFLPQQKDANEMQVPEAFQKSNNMHESYLLRSDFADISGFLGNKQFIKRNTVNNQQFTYNIGWAENENMVIEVQIPLSEIYIAENNKAELSNIVVNFKGKLNALERPSGGQRPSNEGGMSAGRPQGGMQGGGRSGGGGMQKGGGGQGGPPAGMQSMSSVQSFKAKYYLAKQK